MLNVSLNTLDSFFNILDLFADVFQLEYNVILENKMYMVSILFLNFKAGGQKIKKIAPMSFHSITGNIHTYSCNQSFNYYEIVLPPVNIFNDW